MNKKSGGPQGVSRKKARVEGPSLSDSPLKPSLLDPETVTALRAKYESSQPYQHVVLESFCESDRMRSIHEEAKHNMTTTFKETDLFKVYQTGDLGVVAPEMAQKMPHLMALRQALYSSEFRDFICAITGVDGLTDRIDCSANAYVQGCHLLCHDDVIGTRRVSYIVYLTDPDDSWEAADGGALELYPLEESSQVDRGESHGGVQGVPTPHPTGHILPLFNSMAVFAVKPGRSYHSVQEVYADKPRLSISGWYHGPNPPLGADKASLSQIITKGDDLRPFSPLPPLSLAYQSSDDSLAPLSAAELAELGQWVNATYLQPQCIEQVCARFSSDSSVQLKNFLRADIAAAILGHCTGADEEAKLGRERAPEGYTVGEGGDWVTVGPPHKRRHLLFKSSPPSSSSFFSASAAVAAGRMLQDLSSKLFRSGAFAHLLELLTTLRARGSRDEVRRFRPGLDYTVAHYGAMTRVPRLDATLCFVGGVEMGAEGGGVAGPVRQGNGNGNGNGNGKEEDDNNDDDPDDDDADEDDEDEGGGGDDDPWASGDVGGFECYIEADTKEGGDSAEAAEVYKGPSAEGEDEDETSLLSVSPGPNVLSLVMRDAEVMRFVKYVGSGAPSSRWDVAVEYEIDPPGDDEEEEEDEEEDS